ncbi:MAG: hypothetical protein K2K57_10955 [Oscillospiraceae bacterium]|nr:hypothetical protein [Oscillospiraceae bacterium]
MKKEKRYIPRIFAAALLTAMLFGGCALPDEPGRERLTEPTVIAVPEGGWTAEELAAASSIDNVPLTLPLNLRAFGTDYCYVYGSFLDYDDHTKPYCYLSTTNGYNVNKYLDVGFDFDVTEKNLTADTPIKEIFCYNDGISSMGLDSFYINGITFGATVDEAATALGEPDYGKDGENSENTASLPVQIQYYDKNTGKSILFLTFRAPDDGSDPILVNISFYFDGLDNPYL